MNMTKCKTSRRTFLKTAGAAAAAAAIGAPAVHAQTPVLKTTAWGGKWGEVLKGQVIPAFEKEFKCKVETDSAFPYYPKLQATRNTRRSMTCCTRTRVNSGRP